MAANARAALSDCVARIFHQGASSVSQRYVIDEISSDSDNVHIVADRDAIADPGVPGLALHFRHSYGYVCRSSTAPKPTRVPRSSAILGEICGLV
jgi:hypothetical protein